MRPLLTVVCGLPGSGKSTLAKLLARSLRATWISSDAIRVERGMRGDYSDESVARVYAEMMTRAGRSLGQGEAVILDGSFSSRRFREQALKSARAAGVGFALIRMVADEEATLQRVGRRRALTEAGPAAYWLLKRNFDPLECEHLTIDSSTSPMPRMLKLALRYLEARGFDRPEPG